jgi:S-adenosylmethionine synthetase
MALQIHVEAAGAAPLGLQANEYVERKGLGHPDSICDAVMEAICLNLSRAYLEAAGRVLHHNIDKGLLVAGQTELKLGGGKVIAPMRLVVGDRATERFGDQRIPVGEIVETTARQWLQRHLRFVDPQSHLVIQNELQPGSAELVGIFGPPNAPATASYTANDTSAAVGYAPLTETEHLVLAAEHFLNSHEFKQEFPETGEDVKVGRGNRVNGLISLCRPMTMEAAAGKNPVSHVGKIYNLLAHQIANSIYHSVEGVEKIYVWLVSQIGRPLEQPWFASAQLALVPGAALADVRKPVIDIVQTELGCAGAFTARLVRGELPVW